MDYLTNLNFAEKLLIDRRIGPPPKCIKTVKDVLKEVYEVNIINDNDELLMEEFKRANKLKLDSVLMMRPSSQYTCCRDILQLLQ